jgi:ubiquinone/menaquinone biosynthesis C-methylase UbiE
MIVHRDIDAAAWQDSWDRQQTAYMPDREHRFAAMLDVVEATNPDRAPAILDVAGGTGSISLRALERFPEATTTLVDVDPVLLAIARASLDPRSTVVSTDLRRAGWVRELPRRHYDAVLTATALHWIDADRLTALYGEIWQLLRPGGVFINADHMVDPDLPNLSRTLDRWEQTQRVARWASGHALSWEAWWDSVSLDPVLSPFLEDRTKVFAGLHADEFNPDSDWHLTTLRAAGFREAGLIWRGGRDAAVAALR